MDVILAKNTNPINDLPVELLVQIPLLSEKQTYNSKPYPYFRLSWVCRHWRNIINGSPAFWTVIKFSPWKDQEFIRELVSRSGSAAELCVFSPRHSISDEILFAFRELLERDGHRIKFLSIIWTGDLGAPNLLFGKVFPALKVLEFNCGRMSTEPLTVAQSAKHLRYLQISLFSTSSLSLLQPSCHYLKYLNITFSSYPIARQFYFTCLPFCSNLESLTVHTGSRSIIWDEFHILPVITLPNLIFLHVDNHILIHQLRAPALKNLVCLHSLPADVTRQNYLIFDEYDLTSITDLSICGFSIDKPQFSSISIQGSNPLMSGECSMNWSGRFETILQDVDLRREILPFISSTEPTQFFVYAQYLDDAFEVPQSSLLPKLLSKPRNLEVLSIDPRTSDSPYGIIDHQLFREFCGEIFNALVSVKPRWLIITERAGYPVLLRVLLELINTYSSFSNLNRLTYRIDEQGFVCDIRGRDFGEELMKFLRVRREAGCDTLELFEIEGGECLPEDWITEAASLGTQIRQFPSASTDLWR